MSFSESRSPFMNHQPPLQSYVPGSDAINILPQFEDDDHINNNQALDFDPNPPPTKRPRVSPPPHQMQSSLDASAAINNRGINNIFFKTRICAKFKAGTCRNGEHCNFAHGLDDMRQPPPNWQEIVGLRGGSDEDKDNNNNNNQQYNHQNRQLALSGNWEDDQKIIHRMKLCKKFYNGEECPYGDRCNFLHEEPSKFRDDSGRFRESSAISVGVESATVDSVVVEERGGVSVPSSSSSEALLLMRGNVKPVYWKTKLCNKWEQTGHCPFGDKCHFAHGYPELQASSGREMDSMSIASLTAKPLASSNDLVSPGTTNVGPFSEDLQGKKCLLKWKGLKKINRIYGDWLDDLPLSHNLPSRVES